MKRIQPGAYRDARGRPEKVAVACDHDSASGRAVHLNETSVTGSNNEDGHWVIGRRVLPRRLQQRFNSSTVFLIELPPREWGGSVRLPRYLQCALYRSCGMRAPSPFPGEKR